MKFEPNERQVDKITLLFQAVEAFEDGDEVKDLSNFLETVTEVWWKCKHL